MWNCFILDLELENARGTVETSFSFFIACFYNKMNKNRSKYFPAVMFLFHKY